MPDILLTLPKSINKGQISQLFGNFNTMDPESIHWENYVDVITEQGTTGICFDSVRKNGFAKSILKEVYTILESNYRKIQVKNVLLREELRNSLRRLNAAGIQAIVLKGVALFELVYGDIGLRPTSDLDILIRQEDAAGAEALFLEAGYRRAGSPEVRPGFDRLFRVDTPLQAQTPNACVVEIHWQLAGPLFASRYVDHSALWQRAAKVQLVDETAFILSSEDWVLHLCAHAYFTHRSIRLINLVDIDRLIRYFNSQLDWDKFLEIGRDFHWLPAVASLLPLCVELMGTPIPDRIIQTARSARVLPTEKWLLGWWLKPGRPDRQRVIPDWLTLPGVRPRLRVLRAYFFPGRDYLDAQSSEQFHSWKPLVYIHHWWKELGSISSSQRKDKSVAAPKTTG